MSTRWYPLYQKNNPQLRIYLPNFWLKLIKSKIPQPENIVTFHCSIGMTKRDVQNYLEKIYNVKVMEVTTRIAMGKLKRDKVYGYITKEDDFKIAYAILPKDQVFTYPNMFEGDAPSKKPDQALESAKESHKEFLKNNPTPGFPGWFRV